MPLDRSLKQYRVGFLVVDAIAIAGAFLLAHFLRHGQLLVPYLVALPYTVVILLLALKYARAYQARIGGMRETVSVLAGVTGGMAVLLTLGFFYRGFSYSRLTAVYFGVFAVAFIIIGRHVYRFALDALFGRSQWLKRVIIVGDGPHVGPLLEELSHHKSDYHPAGLVATNPEEVTALAEQYSVPVLGTLDDLEEILDRESPSLVILADPAMPEPQQKAVVGAAVERNIHWLQVPRVTAPPDQELELTVVAGIPLLGSKANNITGFNYLLKRAVDIVVASALLILFSPLMIVVAVLIKLFSRGPVLFVQERIGYRRRPFKFYKFRSMHVNNDESIHKEYVKKWIRGAEEAAIEDEDGVKVHKLTRDPRIIPYVGKFIRKFSIDELPQLFNVLKGDMSLVGPRPCLPYEVEMYERWHKMRFDVLPGITGLWQVSGRNRLKFDEMVSLDLRYLQNWSLAMDIAIMLKTPFVVLFDKAY